MLLAHRSTTCPTDASHRTAFHPYTHTRYPCGQASFWDDGTHESTNGAFLSNSGVFGFKDLASGSAIVTTPLNLLAEDPTSPGCDVLGWADAADAVAVSMGHDINAFTFR